MARVRGTGVYFYSLLLRLTSNMIPVLVLCYRFRYSMTDCYPPNMALLIFLELV